LAQATLAQGSKKKATRLAAALAGITPAKGCSEHTTTMQTPAGKTLFLLLLVNTPVCLAIKKDDSAKTHVVLDAGGDVEQHQTSSLVEQQRKKPTGYDPYHFNGRLTYDEIVRRAALRRTPQVKKKEECCAMTNPDILIQKGMSSQDKVDSMKLRLCCRDACRGEKNARAPDGCRTKCLATPCELFVAAVTGLITGDQGSAAIPKKDTSPDPKKVKSKEEKAVDKIKHDCATEKAHDSCCLQHCFRLRKQNPAFSGSVSGSCIHNCVQKPWK